MKLIAISIFYFFFTFSSTAQNLDNLPTAQVDRLFRNNMIMEFDASTKLFTKEYYLSSNYVIADVYLNNNDSLMDIPIKIDFFNDYIVVGNEKTPFTISAFYCETIVLKEVFGNRIFLPKFINNEICFAELVSSYFVDKHSYRLFKYFDTYYLRPNYNAALHSGSKVGQVRKNDRYFLENQVTKKIFQIPSSKRKFKKSISSNFSIERKIIKQLNPKKEKDLLALVDLLNSMY